MNLEDLSKEETARKWIEERKNRFPTKNNIILRKAKNLEKLQRGETIKERWNVPKTTRMIITREKVFKPYSQIAHKTNNYSHIDEMCRSPHSFPNINILQEEDLSKMCLNDRTKQTDFHKETVDNILDVYDGVSHTHVEPKPADLFTLVTNCETEDEDTFPKEMSIKRMQMRDVRDYKIAENIIFKGTFHDVPSCTNANENKLNYQAITNEISHYPIIKRQDKHKYKTNQIAKDKKPEKVQNKYCDNLLQKLLSRSIQYERNLIFQSLKYIVDNNFF